MCAATRPSGHPIARYGMTASAAGLHAGLWLTERSAAFTLMVVEAALTIIVILTALHVPTKISDRAFRLLPWTTPSTSQPTPRASGGSGLPGLGMA